MTKHELLKRLPHHCEVKLKGCLGQSFLTPAHRKNRVEYKRTPELLWDYSQVITACVKCHEWIDAHKDKKEKIFKRLRRYYK